MTTIKLRPDLKTSGGEIHDILLNGRYAGNMTLVYREGDRVAGAVQLDRSFLSKSDKEKVVSYVRDYIQDLIQAVRAADCDIIVTNSEYDHIISTSQDELGRMKEMDDAQDMDLADSDIGDEEADRLGDGDFEQEDRFEMRRDNRSKRKTAYYELVIVGESRNKVEYHVYGKDMKWLAEAFFHIRGTDCSGEIRFMFEPHEEEIEAVVDLVVSDFDEDQIDTFTIRVMYRDTELEIIELTHEDLLDDDSLVAEQLDEDAETAQIDNDGEQGYTVHLARDDGDIVTYELYGRQRGSSVPIGTATVDISSRQLSGFIDFHDLCGEEERELIATLLMRELDKEKEYRSLSLAVMHGNKKIDEMLFESEPVH